MSEFQRGELPVVKGQCGSRTNWWSSSQSNLEEVQRLPADVSTALADLRENSDMILRDTRGLLTSTRQRIERRPNVAVAPREHDPREGLLVEPTPVTIRQPRIMWGL